MSVKRFADAGALLNWLLDAYERRDHPDKVIAHVDYDRIPTHAATQSLRQALETAQRTGAVALEFGRPPHEGHVIKRVRLKDADTLYRHLGREAADSAAKRAADGLRPVVEARPEDIRAIPDELEAGWRRQETPYRLSLADTGLARQFLQLVCGFLDGVHQDVDQRTFARRATGDSKALEHKGQTARVAQVLARHLDLEVRDPAEVLEKLGIRKYPAPICVRGPVCLDPANGGVDFSPLRPYAAMAPDQAAGVRPARAPAYVMTVENFASFNRQAREISDDGLILYTGGFPSRAVRTVIERLDRQLPASVPFLHWGDIDPWGLRIFRHIEEVLERPLRPHLMTAEVARLGSAAAPTAGMRRLAESDSAIAPLAVALAREPAFHLEQEQLDPTPPEALDIASG